MTHFQPPSLEFLTLDECAEVDKALLTAQDKFTARVAIYSLRSLKQIAEQLGVSIVDLTSDQIAGWVVQDPSLQPEYGFDDSFRRFFSQLVISSLNPLKQIAREADVAIEDLQVLQVVSWFEREAKKRLEQS